MIDGLKRMAQAIQVLRLPSLVLGLISLASLVATVFFFTSDQGDRYIIPSIIGLLWGMATYSFIVTFRALPDKPNTSPRFFGKLKHAVARVWYGLISLIFIGAAVTVLVITIRMILIWLRDHG
jgi:hypothetical protein